jgi:hypothetical protein
MATVTETYILEQNADSSDFPSACVARLQAALDSGAIVSNTLTAIVDPAQLVPGKIRHSVVKVFRSEEDRISIENDNLADAELQAYIISSGYTKLNKVRS